MEVDAFAQVECVESEGKVSGQRLAIATCKGPTEKGQSAQWMTEAS